MSRRGTATMPQGVQSSMFAIRLLGVLALVALNAFFAATEFSLVAVRLSRIRQLVAKGSARARVVELLLGDLHRVVSGVQLGMTMTSLAIGAVGEATFAKVFQAMWMGTPGTRSAIVAHGRCAVSLVPEYVPLGDQHAGWSSGGDRESHGSLFAAWPRSRTFHGGAADSNSAGARAGAACRGRRKIHSQRHRTRANPGAGNHGAPAGHAHLVRGIQPGRSDARLCDDAAFPNPGLPRH